MRIVAGNGSGIVGVEVVGHIVVVRVARTIIVDIQVADVEVLVGVAICIEYLLCHRPLNALGAVSYSAS